MRAAETVFASGGSRRKKEIAIIAVPLWLNTFWWVSFFFSALITLRSRFSTDVNIHTQAQAAFIVSFTLHHYCAIFYSLSSSDANSQAIRFRFWLCFHRRLAKNLYLPYRKKPQEPTWSALFGETIHVVYTQQQKKETQSWWFFDVGKQLFVSTVPCNLAKDSWKTLIS